MGIMNSQQCFTFFLDYVDRATESTTAFVSFRERPMHCDDDKTLSVRVVDPVADDGVWRLLLTDVTVVLLVKCGDNALKQI